MNISLSLLNVLLFVNSGIGKLVKYNQKSMIFRIFIVVTKIVAPKQLFSICAHYLIFV